VKYIVALLVFSLMAVTPVQAIDPDNMTPQEYTTIERHCRGAQSIIQRIEYVDPVARVNRGMVYNNLSKLMTALTARAAFNAFSIPALSTESQAIQDQRTQFANDYTAYEIALRDVINDDCAGDPQGFYRKLVDVRSKRAVVAFRIREIERRLDVFSDAVQQLEDRVQAKERQ